MAWTEATQEFPVKLQGTGEPDTELPSRSISVGFLGASRAVGVGRLLDLECIPGRRKGPGHGTLFSEVAA